mmetsp:Transcript_27436/g.36439  ORF Transcript_27436/g.36439 Transcript_27436/m.36439 type:complete len:86 (+) Transcript_27436:39-296(+)
MKMLCPFFDGATTNALFKGFGLKLANLDLMPYCCGYLVVSIVENTSLSPGQYPQATDTILSLLSSMNQLVYANQLKIATITNILV